MKGKEHQSWIRDFEWRRGNNMRLQIFREHFSSAMFTLNQIE